MVKDGLSTSDRTGALAAAATPLRASNDALVHPNWVIRGWWPGDGVAII
jgi:hypothetical protein